MNISTAKTSTTDIKAKEMLKYIALGGTTVGAICAALLLHDVKLSDTVELFDPMTATVVLKTPNGGKCTGTHIGNGTILTAGHCTDKEGDTLTATFKNGREFTAETLWKSESYDVSLLRMADATVIEINDGMPHAIDVIASDNPSASLDCRAPAVGESIHMIGHPLAMTWIKTGGVVAGEVTGAYGTAWREALPIDGAMGPGMSGGGAFDADGEVIGINVGVPIAGNGFGGGYPVGISFIVPASTICGLMGK